MRHALNHWDIIDTFSRYLLLRFSLALIAYFNPATPIESDAVLDTTPSHDTLSEYSEIPDGRLMLSLPRFGTLNSSAPSKKLLMATFFIVGDVGTEVVFKRLVMSAIGLDCIWSISTIVDCCLLKAILKQYSAFEIRNQEEEKIHSHLPHYSYNTGWPRKNARPTINNFKKTRDRLKKLCALLHMEFFFQQDD